jgi:hypothetical protein
MKRADGTGVAGARAQSRSSSGLSSGTLSMLRTPADLPSALALAETALAMGTPLAAESVEYAEPAALASAPDRPRGLRRTALPGVAEPALAKNARWTSLVALRRRVSVLGASSSSGSPEPSPVVSPTLPRRSAPARRVARVFVEPLFVAGAEALVEVEVELERTEDGRERQGEQIVRPRRKRASNTGRVGRRKA